MMDEDAEADHADVLAGETAGVEEVGADSQGEKTLVRSVGLDRWRTSEATGSTARARSAWCDKAPYRSTLPLERVGKVVGAPSGVM